MSNNILMKECKHHGMTEFVLRSDGYYRCCKCASESVQKRREKIKLLAIKYKGGKCQCCGYDKCVEALEFHHIDPATKEFGIGENGYTRSWNKTKQEIDKCILVCANCHREIHCGVRDISHIDKNINNSYIAE